MTFGELAIGDRFIWSTDLTNSEAEKVTGTTFKYLSTGKEYSAFQAIKVHKLEACGPSDDDCDSNGNA